MRAQVNGGSVEDKVDFAYQLFEKPVPVDSVFQANEMIDAIAITKGRGTEGVVTRWGVSRLPRKTHRGLRKVRRPAPDLAAPRCAAFGALCCAACPPCKQLQMASGQRLSRRPGSRNRPGPRAVAIPCPQGVASMQAFMPRCASSAWPGLPAGVSACPHQALGAAAPASGAHAIVWARRWPASARGTRRVCRGRSRARGSTASTTAPR